MNIMKTFDSCTAAVRNEEILTSCISDKRDSQLSRSFAVINRAARAEHDVPCWMYTFLNGVCLPMIRRCARFIVSEYTVHTGKHVFELGTLMWAKELSLSTLIWRSPPPVVSDLSWAWMGVVGGQDSLVLSCKWQGGAFTNPSRVRRGDIF